MSADLVLLDDELPASLLPDESARLFRLEETIERGRAIFLKVGTALMEIRDGRLYRETHGSFEDYCAERWSFSKTQANRLVQASEVAGVLTPIGVIPANEAQARELAPLLDQPELLRETWAEVVDAHEKPTAAIVREAAREAIDAVAEHPDLKPAEAIREHRRLTIPISQELLAKQQRQTLIDGLDRAVRAMELSAEHAHAEARRLLAGGDAGPFTPGRFECVIAFATAFADTLRKAGVNG